MRSVLIMIAFGSLGFALGASILPRTSTKVSGSNLTAEDCDQLLIVVSEDEVTYLSILADDLSAYESALESKTLAAYKMSQAAGNCAASIQRSTVSKLIDAANEARKEIIITQQMAREILTSAKTEEQIYKAAEYVAAEKLQASSEFAKIVANLLVLADRGIKGILNCSSPSVVN